MELNVLNLTGFDSQKQTNQKQVSQVGSQIQSKSHFNHKDQDDSSSNLNESTDLKGSTAKESASSTPETKEKNELILDLSNPDSFKNVLESEILSKEVDPTSLSKEDLKSSDSNTDLETEEDLDKGNLFPLFGLDNLTQQAKTAESSKSTILNLQEESQQKGNMKIDTIKIIKIIKIDSQLKSSLSEGHLLSEGRLLSEENLVAINSKEGNKPQSEVVVFLNNEKVKVDLSSTVDKHSLLSEEQLRANSLYELSQVSETQQGIDKPVNTLDSTSIATDTSVSHLASQVQSSQVAASDQVILKQALSSGHQFTNNLGVRIQWMLQQAVQNAEIMLDPPELGPLHVKLSHTGAEAQVVFQVNTNNGKELIEDNLSKLKEMLSQQGITLGDTQVEQRDQKESLSEDKNNQSNQFHREELEEDTADNRVLSKSSNYSILDAYI